MTLRQHVREMHPNMVLRRAHVDLVRDHARMHYRHSPNHYHAGANLGRPEQRPDGWYTGDDAVPVQRGGLWRHE